MKEEKIKNRNKKGDLERENERRKGDEWKNEKGKKQEPNQNLELKPKMKTSKI